MSQTDAPRNFPTRLADHWVLQTILFAACGDPGTQNHCRGGGGGVSTCDTPGQFAHGGKALLALRVADGPPGVQHIEAVAELEEVLISRNGQPLGQQIVGLLRCDPPTMHPSLVALHSSAIPSSTACVPSFGSDFVFPLHTSHVQISNSCVASQSQSEHCIKRLQSRNRMNIKGH